MQVVETPVFTRRVTEILTDEEYRGLRSALLARPDAGSVIVGTGGARKIRWAADGRGKSGGVRVIYCWAAAREIILMLLVCPKNEQDTLTDVQKKMLRRVVESMT
ncbi:MAG TPA: hypothetical protein VE913_10590 [Longimicrobium sp.]|nr:hypothetical protein [Longimicrobium sp.]